ncbi:hypothetical protein SCP_0900300 [Sparassis crispa]|uniref:Uncharacterized protein n=1 Tax=Sparassis crispa TaxID=139825 RepID=A0A401GVD9_9APHY|nr:hypothetical protein SCP_0900300 [Sparassis crispa]GBE86153.1 hypothetical protein SCP_0900300 [Sparassis crispa]
MHYIAVPLLPQVALRECVPENYTWSIVMTRQTTAPKKRDKLSKRDQSKTYRPPVPWDGRHMPERTRHLYFIQTFNFPPEY